MREGGDPRYATFFKHVHQNCSEQPFPIEYRLAMQEISDTAFEKEGQRYQGQFVRPWLRTIIRDLRHIVVRMVQEEASIQVEPDEAEVEIMQDLTGIEGHSTA